MTFSPIGKNVMTNFITNDNSKEIISGKMSRQKFEMYEKQDEINSYI